MILAAVLRIDNSRNWEKGGVTLTSPGESEAARVHRDGSGSEGNNHNHFISTSQYYFLMGWLSE